MELNGIIPVLITPFTETGEVDEKTFKRYLGYLINQGIHAVIPCGSTGEFAGLTDDERLKVIEMTVEEVNGEIPVIAGTSSVSTRHTIKMTQSAVDAGADAVMVVPPYYCHPNEAEIYAHYKALSEEVDTTFVLYNNPGTSGVDMEPELVCRIAEFSNFKYIKESSGDMTRSTEIMRLCGDKMKVICGCDTLALEMFMFGAVGWISPPSNLIPAQCVRLYNKAVVERDFESAKKLYFNLLPLFTMFENTGKYIQLTKAGLAMQGNPVGIPRLPLLESPKESQQQLNQILDSIQE